MSVVSYLRLKPKPEHVAEFEKHLADQAEAVKKAKGFISLELLRPMDGNGQYVIVSEWESEADFKAWEHSHPHEEIMHDYNDRTGTGYTKMRLNRYR